MKNAPEKIGEIVPKHVEYWQSLNLNGYRGGPFADRTGGLILFELDNLEEAADIISNDPFGLEDLLEQKWIKEWMVE
jgi:uncharacterized protein YciI